MSYTVSQETLDRTNCQNNFRCLEEGPKDSCEALEADSSPVVVTICKTLNPNCGYCKRIDDEHGICACPTRIELYVRYGG